MKYSSVPRPQPLPGESRRATGGGSGIRSLSGLGLFRPRYRGSLWMKICRVERRVGGGGRSRSQIRGEAARRPHPPAHPRACVSASRLATQPQELGSGLQTLGMRPWNPGWAVLTKERWDLGHDSVDCARFQHRTGLGTKTLHPRSCSSPSGLRKGRLKAVGGLQGRYGHRTANASTQG